MKSLKELESFGTGLGGGCSPFYGWNVTELKGITTWYGLSPFPDSDVFFFLTVHSSDLGAAKFACTCDVPLNVCVQSTCYKVGEACVRLCITHYGTWQY